MADKGPTRADLQLEINDRQAVINRQQRELENLRQELRGRLDAQRIVETDNQRLWLDRERLTATVEVLSRRIASDSRTLSAAPINQEKAAIESYRG